MTLFLDLATRSFLDASGSPIESLSFKRRDTEPVILQFLTGGIVTDLGSGATGILGLKPLGAYSSGYIASALSWTKSGTGTSASYAFSLTLNTAEIDALFVLKSESGTLRAMLEVQWTVGSVVTSSVTLSAEIANDVIRGDEGVLAQANPDYPTASDLLTKSGNLGGLVSTPSARGNLSVYSQAETSALLDAKPNIATATPADLGSSAAVGSSSTAARADHVHRIPNLSELGGVATTDARLSDARTPLPHDAALITSGTISLDRLPSLSTGIQVVSSGTIADLTTPQQAQIITGAIVTTTDGRRWLYKGTGSKTDSASYIELGDITPEWTAIANKPTDFTPSAHTHPLSQITQSSATSGQVATWNGSAWIPSTPATSLVTSVAGKTGVVTLATSDVTGLQTALDGKQAAGSYATLVGGTVPASQLPSYVDDVLEYASLAAFPVTGETGKIYTATGTNKIYRWSGSTYIEISPSPGSTDSVTEGSTNLYFTAARAISALASTLASYATTSALSTAISGLSSVYTTTTAVASQITTALTGYATQAWVTAQSYATVSGVTSSISSAISSLGLGTASTKAIADFAPAFGIAPSAITGTAVITGDSRLSDARTPTAHTHPLSDLTQSSATTGQVATWNGSAWVPVTPSAAGVSSVAGRAGAVTLSASDVSGLATVATSGAYADLSGKPTIPASQVQSDWNASTGLGVILNKPTIPSATTDASLLTSGTLADARLSSNIATKSAANTFTQNQTFAGTANTAPSQTAASGSSLMTRDLVDDEAFFSLGSNYRPAALAFGNLGTGSAATLVAPDRMATLSSGTATSGYGRASVARGFSTIPSYSGGGIAFGFRKIGIACRLSIGATSYSITDPRVRMVIGGNGGVPATADANALSVVGFGWEYGSSGSAHQWRLFAHNGSAYVTSAWQSMSPMTLEVITPFYLSVYSDAVGNITGYFGAPGSRSLSSVTMTGGPTTSGVLANSYADLVVVNSTTGTSTLSAALTDCLIIARA